MEEEYIEQIIASLDPQLVPWYYIDLAVVTGLDGIEREVKGDELFSLLNHPSLEKVAVSVQVLVDQKKLKNAMLIAIDDFWLDALSKDD